MQKQKFVNLHGHTYGSLLDSIIRPNELFTQAKKLGYSAMAVTDHGNMSQIYPCYLESKNTYDLDENKKPIPGTGVKLIPGNEIYFCEDLTDPKAKRRHLVLLASNAIGYRNLCRITYEGFLNSVTVMGKQFPRVDAAILAKYNEGLFATSACGGSIIAAHLFAGEPDAARRQAQIFKDIFGDRFYIELQPHTLSRGSFSQVDLNNMIKALAEEMQIPMVATCDSHYLVAEDEKHHDMVLAISSQKAISDTTRHRYVSSVACEECNGAKCDACANTGIGEIIPCPEFYVKTEAEIRKFFTEAYSAEFAETLIDNTAKISAACEEPKYLEPTGEHIPQFDMKMIKGEPDEVEFLEWLEAKPERKEISVPNAFMRFRVAKAYRAYMKKMNFDKATQKKYWDRVLFELDILESKGFCSYMLVVADAMNWCERNNVWRGTSRGSAASSLSAFLLGIHKVDPVPVGLLFERFQSKERPACPDIDSDIESGGRDSLLAYMKERWGAEYTCQITNVNKITPKVALKDIAKSLEIGGSRQASFALADKITKSVPLKVTLPDGKIVEIRTMELAHKYSPELRGFLDEYPEVEQHAKKIVGLPRSWGVHAGGIVVSDVPLPDFIPMRRDSDKIISTAYDKDVSEKLGLIKIDMLGLDTIDVMKRCWESANRIGIKLPKPDDCPEDDQAVYNLIGRGDVLGLFQLEGGTLAKLCKPIKPRCIEDISLINALGRPGVSKEKREQFIRRRDGLEKVEYVHEELRAIQEPTLGISTYDEDLLKISQHIAGWSLSKADGLRKLTKLKEKGADLAVKLEKEFVEDAAKLGRVTKDEAQLIWDVVIADYAKYGFCLAADQLVVCEDGNKPISEINTFDKVSWIDKEGKEHFDHPLMVWCSGEKEVFEVELEDGSIVKGTKDHKFQYAGEWHTLGELIEIGEMEYHEKEEVQ